VWAELGIYLTETLRMAALAVVNVLFFWAALAMLFWLL
jgi:hypothetical protein